MPQISVSETEFEAKFDEIFAGVEAGQSFDITRDGIVIAELVPKTVRSLADVGLVDGE